MLKIANELKDLPKIALSKVNDLQGDFKELSEKNAAKLIANIEKYGYKYPLYIWFDKQGNAYNLDGNQRQNVLSKLYGPDLELPYIAVSAKNKTEAKKQILALNSDFGKVTQSGFEMLISDFSEMDLGEVSELFTFEWPELEPDTVLPETEGDDIVPEITKEPFVVRGDIFEIKANGVKVRIGCLDSTNSDDIGKLMAGQKAQIGFTSPPYNSANTNIKVHSGYYKEAKHTFYEDGKIDKKSKTEYFDFCINVLKTYSIYLDAGNHALFWNVMYNANSRDDYGKIVFSEQNPFTVKETIIWDKKHAMNIAGSGILSRIAELIFLMSSYDKYLTNQSFGENSTYWNVWRIGTLGSQLENHKACFPFDLPKTAIIDFSQPNHNILDLFCGSGTTAVACLKTKRNCFTNDISENYVQVAVKRCIDFCDKNGMPYEISLNGKAFDVSKLQ